MYSLYYINLTISDELKFRDMPDVCFKCLFHTTLLEIGNYNLPVADCGSEHEHVPDKKGLKVFYLKVPKRYAKVLETV